MGGPPKESQASPATLLAEQPDHQHVWLGGYGLHLWFRVCGFGVSGFYSFGYKVFLFQALGSRVQGLGFRGVRLKQIYKVAGGCKVPGLSVVRAPGFQVKRVFCVVFRVP